MRHLILMRHAEAGFAGVGQNDFDRPLTERGIQSVLSQAKILRDHKILPDKIICSPALRTKTTWDVLHSQVKDHLSIDFQIDTPQSLYNASTAHITELIRGTYENVDILCLIGHNPGIHEITMSLSEPISGQPHSPLAMKTHASFPPATMAVFDFHGRNWFEASHKTLTLKHFLPPRDYSHS